jgi:hypothetical protein
MKANSLKKGLKKYAFYYTTIRKKSKKKSWIQAQKKEPNGGALSVHKRRH